MAKDAKQIYQDENKVPCELAAIKYDIMHNYNISML